MVGFWEVKEGVSVASRLDGWHGGESTHPAMAAKVIHYRPNTVRCPIATGARGHSSDTLR